MHPHAGQPPLVPCRAQGPGTELFIVEGESAAGAVARVRDEAFQAVLALRGKPLNALRAPRGRVAGHAFFAALSAALGVPLGGDGMASPARYERLLLLMDPDADGIHCGALVVAFLHRWMPFLLDRRCVEIVRPPWGEVVAADGTPALAWSDAELRGLATARPAAAAVRRFRGLAALDAALLARTCVAPATRRAQVVAPAHAAEIALLLGE
jgi:DNA gyrase subunit B/topoisomerase-4 subunit B